MHERQTASPEVLDRRQAAEATGGDDDLLREIVAIFLEDCPRMIEELAKAAKAGDVEALRRAAHTLKGSVSVLGAKALALAAKDVEDAARGGDVEAATLAFGRVEEESERLVPVLEGLLRH